MSLVARSRRSILPPPTLAKDFFVQPQTDPEDSQGVCISSMLRLKAVHHTSARILTWDRECYYLVTLDVTAW
jgi:hypothetical protein